MCLKGYTNALKALLRAHGCHRSTEDESMFFGNEKAFVGLVAAVVAVFVGAGFIDAEQGLSLTNVATTLIVAVGSFVTVWLKGNSS